MRQASNTRPITEPLESRLMLSVAEPGAALSMPAPTSAFLASPELGFDVENGQVSASPESAASDVYGYELVGLLPGSAVMLSCEGVVIAQAAADADGIARLITDALPPGQYEITFATDQAITSVTVTVGGACELVPTEPIDAGITNGTPASVAPSPDSPLNDLPSMLPLPDGLLSGGVTLTPIHQRPADIGETDHEAATYALGAVGPRINILARTAPDFDSASLRASGILPPSPLTTTGGDHPKANRSGPVELFQLTLPAASWSLNEAPGVHGTAERLGDAPRRRWALSAEAMRSPTPADGGPLDADPAGAAVATGLGGQASSAVDPGPDGGGEEQSRTMDDTSPPPVLRQATPDQPHEEKSPETTEALTLLMLLHGVRGHGGELRHRG